MVTLRPTQFADAPLLAQLETRIFTIDAWPAADIAGLLGVFNVFGYVAEVECQPVGYALIQAAPKAVADILTLGVVPEARQKGVAACLLFALFEKAKELEVPRVFLEVRQSNLAAQKFYEKHGGQQAGRRPRYYRSQDGMPSEDALVYQFNL